MIIGFDAKRAYHNQTGLGHYSRTLIRSLARYFPENEYVLFNPKPSSLFSFREFDQVKEILPSGVLNKTFSSAWRSNWVKKDLMKHKVSLYHGLSHEIPLNLHKTYIKSVVTIHDLIHERYPHQYTAIDRRIYSKKFKYACEHADVVIAISEQTKKDIIEFYHTDASKIKVCYQSCNEAFGKKVSDSEKLRVKQLYNLPDNYFLYVGSLIERKNLLGICKAINIMKQELTIQLVVIGNGGSYKQLVQQYIKEQQLEHHIIFLSDNSAAKTSPGFQSAADFPAIYQQAKAMIYPSFFEGFGIPVLEALWSRLPVITSSVSCLPEAGGPGAFYVNPDKPEEIASQIEKICLETELVFQQVEKGWHYAQKFSNKETASSVMNLYKTLL
jgi:glycosyltransferase involved in cell wall biosynthesis